MTPAELIGATGLALLLLAFSLASAGWLASRSALYHALNLVGAGLAAAGWGLTGSVPSAVLAGAWASLAALALLRALWVARPRRNKKPKIRARTTRRGARKNPSPYLSPPEPGTDSQTEVMGQDRPDPDDVTAPLTGTRGRAAGREGRRG